LGCTSPFEIYLCEVPRSPGPMGAIHSYKKLFLPTIAGSSLPPFHDSLIPPLRDSDSFEEIKTRSTPPDLLFYPFSKWFSSYYASSFLVRRPNRHLFLCPICGSPLVPKRGVALFSLACRDPFPQLGSPRQSLSSLSVHFSSARSPDPCHQYISAFFPPPHPHCPNLPPFSEVDVPLSPHSSLYGQRLGRFALDARNRDLVFSFSIPLSMECSFSTQNTSCPSKRFLTFST